MDDEGLVPFLFGVQIGDQAGLAILDGSEDDGTGGVYHSGKIRINGSTSPTVDQGSNGSKEIRNSDQGIGLCKINHLQ